jgi:hypothetical protein
MSFSLSLTHIILLIFFPRLHFSEFFDDDIKTYVFGHFVLYAQSKQMGHHTIFPGG